MLNVLAVPEAVVVETYMLALRFILAGAHVRNVLFQGQHMVSARIWNGTHGFTTSQQEMNRAALDKFRVESCVSAVAAGVMKWHTFFDLIDYGVTHQNIDDPLCGHDPSEWGDVGIGPMSKWSYAVTLRDMVTKRMQEIRNNNAVAIHERLCATPEARALGEEVHARFLKEAPVIRDRFVRDTLKSMGGSLQTLVEENVSTADILSAVEKMVGALRSIPKPETAGNVGDALEQWGAHAKAQTDKQRVTLMGTIRKEVAEGTFHPAEWLWCFTGDTVGVGQKADGSYAKLPFTDEDIAFIREHCSPTEVDWNTLYYSCLGNK